MGWDGGTAVRLGPCSNCGKAGGGRIGFSRIGNAMVCSEACGKRLDQRIKNGMVGAEKFNVFAAPWGAFDIMDTCKEFRLRNRIKQLKAKIKELDR